MKKKAFTPVKKYLTGFTLAELLIVMVIIAILAMVVIVSYNNARVQARDSRRISDIASLTSAVRLYYSKTLYYPNISTSWCYFSGSGCLSGLTTGNTYIQALPSDPKYTTSTDYYAYIASTTNAILRAKMEDTTDIPASNYSVAGGVVIGTTASGVCDSSATPANYDYCVRMIP